MIWKARALLLVALLSAGLEAATIATRPSPEFVFQVPGGQFLLSQSRGKVTLLMFLFTTCPHCQGSIQPLNMLMKEYGPQGFQVFGAAFNDGAEQLTPGFVAKFRPAFPVGYANRASVLDYLHVKANEPLAGVPILVLIDRKGVIRSQYAGDALFKDEEKKTRALIESLLKEPAAAKGTKKAGH